MPYMYILECSDGSYYTVSKWNLEKRLWKDQNGEGSIYTKKRLPVRLIYFEETDRIDEAYEREKQTQGWSRRKKQALMDDQLEMLIEFSKSYSKYAKERRRGEVAVRGDVKPRALEL